MADQDLPKPVSLIRTYLLGGMLILEFFLLLLNGNHMLPMGWSDFLFVSLLLLAFALYRPGWSFLLFVGSIPLENIILFDKLANVRPYQLLGLVTLLAIITRFFWKRLNFSLPKLHWSDALFVLLGVASVLSALGSVERSASLKQSLVLGSFILLYALTRIFVQNLDDLKRVFSFFLASSVPVVLYGLWQNMRFAAKLESFEIMPGRPNATFSEPDWLGIYLVFVVAVLFATIFHLRDDQPHHSDELRSRNFELLWAYSYLVPVLALLIITVSRSAWAGVFFLAVVFLITILTNLSLKVIEWDWKGFFKTVRNLIAALTLSVLVVIAFNLTTFQLFNRASSTGSGLQKITVACREVAQCGNTLCALPKTISGVAELEQYGCRHINLENVTSEQATGATIREVERPDPNIGIRGRIYRQSLEIIRQHMILGIGWGSIGAALGTDARGTSLNSSNIFLEVWLGTGVVGFGALLILWLYLVIRSMVMVRSGEMTRRMVGMFVLLGSVALLVPNLFNAGIFLGVLWVFWGVVISLVNDENL
ncbi:O-antigen ligase domain-containing protein [Patescibacteria group bacterium]|nr:MAG: O-antigen ligase domain-containing protein [Patescibacteria group bacterium]